MYLHTLTRLALIFCIAALCAAGPAGADVLEISSAGEASWTARQVPGKPTDRTQPASRRTPSALAPLFQTAAAKAQVSPHLLEAVASTESAFRSDAVSPKGARGVMQLMPATARMLGVANPDDAAQNIEGGAAYLAGLLQAFNGDTVLALAAYNAGPGAVRRHRGVPPYRETQAYVDRVLARLATAAERNP